MIAFALKGMLARKLRTALTAIAIVLGVAMISGTYVLTDSIDQAFDAVFTEIYRGTDASITGKTAFDIEEGSGSFAPTFDESLTAEVLALPQVEDAIGGVGGEAQLIGRDGKAIVFGGAPQLGFSIDPSKPQFNTLTLVDGAWPGDGEVVVDTSTAGKKHLEIGQTIGVQAEGPRIDMRISGLTEFGGVASIGGATLAGFNLETAQRLFEKEGRLDQIRVAGKGGVAPEALVAAIREILPPGTQVRTGDAQAREDASGTDEFIGFLQNFLLAFGGIALFVGSFVIANSLSITIAQRTREFATLRTIGASRRQVMGSIILESLVIGATASLVGLFLGLALATGLFELFDAVGFTLPNNGLVLEGRTIVVSLVVGILVTLLASVRPALRATRVPPIAAVREGATLPESRLARFRTAGSTVLTALGFAGLIAGLFVPDLGTAQILLLIGVGAVLIFFGVALLSTRLVGPMALLSKPVARWCVFALSLLIYPVALGTWIVRNWLLGRTSSPRKELGAIVLALVLFLVQAGVIVSLVLARGSIWTFVAALLAHAAWNAVFAYAVWSFARRRGTHDWPIDLRPDPATSRIGEQNTQRNPQRTASTASALMIGLALVTLVATLAAGIIQTFRGAVDDLWKTSATDYAITAQNNFSPIPPAAAAAVAKVPGVDAVMDVRTGETLVFGKTILATAVDPTARELILLKWKHGSQEVLADLGADGAFVDDDYAASHHLAVGSPLTMTFAEGATATFRVEGIFDPPAGGSPFGRVTISVAAWDERVSAPRNLYSFVAIDGDESPANTAALEAALAGFPNAKAQTREGFIDNQIAGLSSILNILYVLLALSVVVSLFGIVNTLVLSVFERTREIGMLRAIGMTRRQVRRMIRHESVITALIGGALGIVLGVVLAALLVARVDFIDFSLPIGQLIVFAILTIVVGILAAIFPARRAAKLDPLEALQYE